MKRDIDIDEISDGRRYRSGDMVKIGCSECAGCSECCRLTDDTIILDPYDIFELCRGLNTSFDALLSEESMKDTGSKYGSCDDSNHDSKQTIHGHRDSAEAEAGAHIELGIADGIILPHLKINKNSKGCTFLSPEGRCTIHSFRPGFCRLYPLGRIYENGSFSYFLQVNECPYPNKTKVKIKKWLGINSLPEYEDFVLKWHDILERTREEARDLTDPSDASRYLASFLRHWYQTPYDLARPFYEQFRERLDMWSCQFKGNTDRLSREVISVNEKNTLRHI